ILQQLSKLAHLTDLTLIGFDFVGGHSPLYPITSVTKLTVSSREALLNAFCTEHDPDKPQVNRLDVEHFRRTLFDQFPILKQLTLIGNVYQHQLARERLTRELNGRLERLDMFIRNK